MHVTSDGGLGRYISNKAVNIVLSAETSQVLGMLLRQRLDGLRDMAMVSKVEGDVTGSFGWLMEGDAVSMIMVVADQTCVQSYHALPKG